MPPNLKRKPMPKVDLDKEYRGNIIPDNMQIIPSKDSTFSVDTNAGDLLWKSIVDTYSPTIGDLNADLGYTAPSGTKFTFGYNRPGKLQGIINDYQIGVEIPLGFQGGGQVKERNMFGFGRPERDARTLRDNEELARSLEGVGMQEGGYTDDDYWEKEWKSGEYKDNKGSLVIYDDFYNQVKNWDPEVHKNYKKDSLVWNKGPYKGALLSYDDYLREGSSGYQRGGYSLSDRISSANPSYQITDKLGLTDTQGTLKRFGVDEEDDQKIGSIAGKFGYQEGGSIYEDLNKEAYQREIRNERMQDTVYKFQKGGSIKRKGYGY